MILNTNTRTHSQYIDISGDQPEIIQRDLVFFFLFVFEFAATTAKIGHSWNTKPSGEVTLGVPSTMVR